MVPATPLVPPIVHTATYRVNSVEHFQHVISQVNNSTVVSMDRANVTSVGVFHPHGNGGLLSLPSVYVCLCLFVRDEFPLKLLNGCG